MVSRKIIFGLLAFLALFAGCDKNPSKAKKKIFIISDISYKLPTARLCAEFEEKTGIEPVISIAPGGDILAMVKLGRSGDILIAGQKHLEYISNAGDLAAYVEVGSSGSQQNAPRVYATGLNYSKNSMQIMQFIEFARDRGPEIFTK